MNANYGRVQQLSLPVAAGHQQPSLVGGDTVATEENCLLRREQDGVVLGHAPNQRSQGAEWRGGGEDEGRGTQEALRTQL